MRSPWRRFLISGLVLAACGCGNGAPQQPSGAEPPRSDVELVQAFARAYPSFDAASFAALHADSAEAAFRFHGHDASGDLDLDLATWVRLHARVLGPATGDDPGCDPDLWLTGMGLQLVSRRDFVERTDLYFDPIERPQGLDPAHWRATGAVYASYLLFETVGNTDYGCSSELDFVVVEDRRLAVGAPRKFLLHRLEDRAARSCWAALAELDSCP